MLESGWTPSEIERRDQCERGLAVVANMRRDHHLIAWARGTGRLVRIDRKSEWGNPFIIGPDGDRDAVCDRYADRLPHRAQMMQRIPTLTGKVLLCWCHPARCHGHTLAQLANGGGDL